MSRKILFTILLTLLCLFGLALVNTFFLQTKDYPNPLRFGNPSHMGYFEIQPETIIDKLNQGELDVFTPSSEDMFSRNEPNYPDIHWSQNDYLKIVDAVSREIWHEPLDLKKWNILLLSAQQDCVDNPQGFYDFDIVYFQNSERGFWDREYQVRHVEVIPWKGFVLLGEGTFADTILHNWGSANLPDFQVTAEDALFIAEKNGGSKMRQEARNPCWISVQLINYPPVNGYTHNDWIVDYGTPGSYIRINPFSGKFRVINSN
jgi:hypothetical protein